MRTLLAICLVLAGCGPAPGDDDDDDTGTEPRLVLRLAIDPEAPRLDNFGRPAELAEGHAAQSPVFHALGVHAIELTPSALTLPGRGEVVFESPETDAGGETALDFAAEPRAAPGAEVVAVPLAEIAPGEYPYLRVAVAYQEYDLALRAEYLGNSYDITGRLASFLESLSYITTFELDGETIEVNANKPQGYWAFHHDYVGVRQGQVPAGAITVPNPIAATSPIEVDSCLVTGAFAEPLVLTGDEREDVVVTATFSSNHSFEWIDENANGAFEPLLGELPTDMGLRGMTASVSHAR